MRFIIAKILIEHHKRSLRYTYTVKTSVIQTLIIQILDKSGYGNDCSIRVVTVLLKTLIFLRKFLYAILRLFIQFQRYGLFRLMDHPWSQGVRITEVPQ